MLTLAPLKTPTKHRENNSSREKGTGEQRHRGNQRNPLNPSKIKGKLINTHQNSSKNHQGSFRISQNHFLIHFAIKSNTNTTRARRHGTAPLRTNRSPEPQRRDDARRTHLDFPVWTHTPTPEFEWPLSYKLMATFQVWELGVG